VLTKVNIEAILP